MSRHRFQVLHFRDVLAQLLLNAHDHRHDRAGAATAGAAQTEAVHAIGHVEHFESRAVHVERGTDLLLEDLGDAFLQIAHGRFSGGADASSLARAMSLCNWATSSSLPAKARVSRMRSTKDTRRVWP